MLLKVIHSKPIICIFTTRLSINKVAVIRKKKNQNDIYIIFGGRASNVGDRNMPAS